MATTAPPTYAQHEAHVSASALTASAPAPASTPTPAPPPGDWIFPTYANTDCWKDYQPGTILGRGGFGTTYKAVKKDTGEEFAVKMISKRKMAPEDIQFVRHEVAILHHLCSFDHPHIIEVKQVYEDKNYVCLVMELCTGGELLDAIVKRGTFSERDAAWVMRTVLDVVAHCHRMGVMHRDIKPENFLLTDSTEASKLKAIDFGLSQFFKEGQVFTELVGSLLYLAPEVINECYGKQADLWSCGAMLYLLLCGRPPFLGKTDADMLKAIATAPLDLTSEPWPSISDQAKDCVRRLLDRDPKTRASAVEILQHPWLAENGVARTAPMGLEVLSRLQAFASADRLQREAMRLISMGAAPEATQGVAFIWQGIKRTGSKRGFDADDFLGACRRKGVTHLSDEEIMEVFKSAVREDGDGLLDYQDFAAATTNVQKSHESQLHMAFKALDIDGDGMISQADLEEAAKQPRSALQGMTNSQLSAVIRKADLNDDGTLDFSEFKAMLATLVPEQLGVTVHK